MKRKILAVLLACAALSTMAACGNTATAQPSNAEVTSAGTEAVEATPEETVEATAVVAAEATEEPTASAQPEATASEVEKDVEAPEKEAASALTAEEQAALEEIGISEEEFFAACEAMGTAVKTEYLEPNGIAADGFVLSDEVLFWTGLDDFILLAYSVVADTNDPMAEATEMMLNTYTEEEVEMIRPMAIAFMGYLAENNPAAYNEVIDIFSNVDRTKTSLYITKSFASMMPKYITFQ